MKTFSLDMHSLFAFGLGGENKWQSFVDNYNEIYNEKQIDGFEQTPTKLDYNFNQLIAQTGATTLPAYVDPESPGYERALNSVEGAMGNIPTFKAFYHLNRTLLRERLQLISKIGEAALTDEMRNVFLGMIDESTDGLINGYYNALTHQRMQIVSTGKFTINATNNPRGLQGITIDFNIASNHFEDISGGTDAWWTNTAHTTEGSTSDPIDYIKKRLKVIRKTYHSYVPMQLEISDALWTDLKDHSKVRTAVGYTIVALPATDAQALAAGKRMTDEDILAKFSSLIGIPVVVRDSLAWVDTPDQSTHKLVQNEIQNFEPKNIAFVPQGKIGEIQGVTPLTLGYESKDVAFYDGDRLALTQRIDPRTHSMYIDSEAAQLCVPTMPQHMYISTVTK